MKQRPESDRKVGRPLEFSRQKAVEAAMNLFWERGVAAVTNRDLAVAMGIQRSSYYNSFGSKEAVFQEALDCYGGIAPDRVLGAVGEDQAVIPALTQFLRELCRLRANDPEGRGCLICNSAAALSGSDTEEARILAAAIRERIRVARRLFTRAIDRGELDGDADPEALAHGFVAFLIGLNVLSRTVRNQRQLWRACQSYLASLNTPSPER